MKNMTIALVLALMTSAVFACPAHDKAKTKTTTTETKTTKKTSN